MDGDFDWSLSRTFLAVIRAGSFSAAGRRLRQAPPTVRRQIEQLEADIGAQLFSRHQDGVRPTPIADRLAPLAEQIETAAGAFARASRTERLTGVMRIAADDLVATRLLPPILAAIQAAHRGMRFVVLPVAGVLGSDARAADLTISFERPTAERMIASRLASLSAGLFASACWVERNGIPSDADDLDGPAKLVGDADDTTLTAFFAPTVATLPQERFAIRTRSREAGFAAVLAGLGAGVLPTTLAESDSRLFRLLPGISSTLGLWLSTHPDLKNAPQVRVTIDALRAGLQIP